MLIFILTKLTWQKLSRDPTNFYCHSFSINLFIFTAFRVIKQQFQTLWLQSSVSTSEYFCSLGWTYCLELQNTSLCILTLVGQVMSMSVRVRVRYPKFICFVETYWQLAIFDIGNLLILNPQNLYLQGCQYLCKTWHVCTWAVYPHTSDKVKIKDKDLKTKLSICIEL